MTTDLPFDCDLLEADEAQRPEVLNRLLDRHRARLLRMVRMRLHPQVRTRVDASDVIQEAYLEICERVDDYVADPRMPFFLWARRIAGDRLLKAHRFHLDAKQRDVRRQASPARSMPDVSAVALVDQLEGVGTSPSLGAARAEQRQRIAAMLDELSDIDREVLCMRHFEELSNEEVALELGLGKHAASKRYIRALKRLRGLIGTTGRALDLHAPSSRAREVMPVSRPAVRTRTSFRAPVPGRRGHPRSTAGQ